MAYTFFLGDWSYMDGPHCLYVEASTDGFANSWTNVALHGVWYWNDMKTTTPYDYCPNNMVDDLSCIGTLAPGETVGIRFYAVWQDYGSIPAGFWNKSSNNYNLTVDFTPIPEPATYSLLLLGVAALLGTRRLRRRLL